MTRFSLGAFALSASLIAVPLMAFAAADVTAEINAAATHAGLAAKATMLDTVHVHMQHALNCLVGPGGTGFDATAFNPCQGKGAGIIADTGDAAKKAKFDAIAAELRGGLKDSALASSVATASKVASELDALK